MSDKTKPINNLDGFKDYLELENDHLDNSFKQSDFKLLDFLEKEIERLESINSFFSKKVENLKRCNQIDHLVALEKENNAQIIEELTHLFSDKDSTFNRRLSSIFKT